jgi:hypothetical protein
MIGHFCCPKSTSDQYGVSRISYSGFCLASAAANAATPLPKEHPQIMTGFSGFPETIWVKTRDASSFNAVSLIMPIAEILS